MRSEQEDQQTVAIAGQTMVVDCGAKIRSAKLLRGVDGFIADVLDGSYSPFSVRQVDGVVSDHEKPVARRRGMPEDTAEQRYLAAIPGKRFKAFKELVSSRGERYASCTLDNFEADTEAKRKVVDAVRSFIDDMENRLRSMSGGLVFVGPVGTGKDHLLFSAMREAILTYGYSVNWSDGLQLFSQIKQAVGTHTTDEFMKTMVQPQILGLSDPVPPRGELTDFEMRVLRDVVDKRYAKGLPIWLTTNVTDREDGDRLFSSPVMDRMKDGAEVISCDWTSYRRLFQKEGDQ